MANPFDLLGVKIFWSSDGISAVGRFSLTLSRFNLGDQARPSRYRYRLLEVVDAAGIYLLINRKGYAQILRLSAACPIRWQSDTMPGGQSRHALISVSKLAVSRLHRS